jgi:hypothetical protein
VVIGRCSWPKFRSPWRADKIPGGYVVRDANREALMYVYSRYNATEAPRAKMLTADEARRVAVNIARLPELLGKRIASRMHWRHKACGLSRGPGQIGANFRGAVLNNNESPSGIGGLLSVSTIATSQCFNVGSIGVADMLNEVCPLKVGRALGEDLDDVQARHRQARRRLMHAHREIREGVLVACGLPASANQPASRLRSCPWP